MHPDELDILLTRSDPAAELSTEERQEIATLATQAVPIDQRKRYLRPVAIGALAVSMLVGGGVAAAAGSWPPFSDEQSFPALHYKTPSGATCVVQYERPDGNDETNKVIQQAIRSFEIDENEISSSEALGEIDRTTLTDDEAYSTAFMFAVESRIEIAIQAAGLTPRWSGIESERRCG